MKFDSCGWLSGVCLLLQWGLIDLQCGLEKNKGRTLSSNLI